MISVIKLNGGVALFGMRDVNVLCLCHIVLSSVGDCSSFAVILLNLFWVFLSGHRRVVFSLCCRCFYIIFLD
jgi:hypothetical protein